MDFRNAILACGLICSLQTLRAAQCSYTFTPASISYSAAATNGSFSVAVGSSCSWTATTTNGWLVPSGSGTGNGTVTYTVQANTGAARVGAIDVGTKSFVV